MIRRTILLMVAVALMTLALAACGGGSSGGGSAANVTVTMTDFKFDPGTVTVNAGQTVNLTLKNAGSVQHSWVMPDLNLKYTVDAGKTDTKTFTAPTKAGTYAIVCDIAGHKEAGMTGQLVVK